MCVYGNNAQAVPRINLIKISHSHVNIFFIFITFLSGEFQLLTTIWAMATIYIATRLMFYTD